MSLKLQDLMKKAEKKGITAEKSKPKKKLQPTRPWQEESVLFQPEPQDPILPSNVASSKTNSTPATRSNLDQAAIITQKSDNKPSTNRVQTDNKPGTNRQQTNNKPTTKRQQNFTELTTNRVQSDNKNQTDNKPSTKTSTELTTNRVQSDNKSGYSQLSGTQRNLVVFIYIECKKSRSKETGPLTLEYISSCMGIKKNTIKVSLQRVERKGYITRTNYKIGRGGWAQFELQDSIHQELMLLESNQELITNWQQSDNKSSTEPSTKDTVVSSSNIINTNTINSVDIEILGAYTEINYSSLERHGFEKNHLVQVVRHYKKKPDLALSPEMVQDSIDAMNNDIENNFVEGLKMHPVSFLVTLLKSGSPYSSKDPGSYKSPRERALEEYQARKALEKERRDSIEMKAMESAFQEWFEQLSDKEIQEFVPNFSENEVSGLSEKIQRIKRMKEAKANSRDYFKLELWPKLSEEIVSMLG